MDRKFLQMEDLILNEKDFYRAFDEVITKKDEVTVLYSSIYNFIFNIKFKSKNIRFYSHFILYVRAEVNFNLSKHRG